MDFVNLVTIGVTLSERHAEEIPPERFQYGSIDGNILCMPGIDVVGFEGAIIAEKGNGSHVSPQFRNSQLYLIASDDP